MSIALGLELRQTPSLVLTPQLQQAIRLLQLAGPELEAAVASEVARNPFLVRSEATQPAGRLRPERQTAAVADDPDGWLQPAGPLAADRRLRARRVSPAAEGEALPSLAERLTRPPGLHERLAEQIGADVRDPHLRTLALGLVGFVDEDGYLRESDEELANLLGAPRELVAAARAALQRCEPTGVGARDLAECLALQLAERQRLDPAMRALLARLDLVARADFRRLERICGVGREDLEAMVAELRTLDPRPGARFGVADPDFAVPDLVVRRDGPSGWRIALNPAAFPKLSVDRAYYAELTSLSLDSETRRFLDGQVQEASFLVRALQQRARTILRVGRAIFARQRRFLEEGPAALAPLVLREVAEALGLHESTVSRAVAGKSVATPHGVFALRYFFTARVNQGAGEELGAEAIRVRIRRLIDQESAETVLSDEEIVARLAAEGIRIARRTVAKYREAMGIPSSVERRRLRTLGR
ncbi:RNA polymerase sigma-54 factor 1 [bacterium HR40]|nr:RNA polymerase sigma-54 factor 1 [bacterium HR40]